MSDTNPDITDAKLASLPYHEFVATLNKPGEDVRAALTAEQANLWHMGTGVAGEAGELLDAIKAHVVYQKPLDMTNVIEELGDLEFFMQGIRTALGISRETTLGANKAKLAKRYAGLVYSDKAAQDRADKA